MSAAGIVGVKPFLPANDFEVSFEFYVALGFKATRLGDGLALMESGAASFLLQRYDARSYAQHLMLQLVVEDLEAWWARLQTLELAARFSVPAPREPAMQPWGLRVQYLVDPTGMLWHVVEKAR